MGRQGTAGGKIRAARPSKAASRKRRSAPKAKVNRGRSAASLQEQLDRRTRELAEALEQQTATSDILRAIAATPGDAEGTLRKIAETTARLFDAAGVSFRIVEGDEFKLSASVGQGADQISSTLWEDPAKRPTVRGRNMPGTVVRENRQIHLPDLDHLGDEFADWPGPPVARSAGIRTMVATPLRTEGSAIGALMVYRNVLQPFTPAELQLLQSFAAQAVIAIENERLLNELRQRTVDLTESLEQQTATAEVLRIISSSPSELDPVFQSMLDNAVRICEAKFGNLYLCDREKFVFGAEVGSPPEYAEFQRQRGAYEPAPGTLFDCLRRTREVISTADAAAETVTGPVVKLGGARSFVGVPMLKDGELIGAIAIYRQEVRPFTDKQIALVQNFAAQAVIAIENARLLGELRQRTDDLTESLEQQTATSDVLQIISTSAGDLEPVFDTIMSNAVRICDAKFGVLFRIDNEVFNVVAHCSLPLAYSEFIRERPSFRPGPGGVLDRLLRTKDVVHVADVSTEVGSGGPARLGGARSLICVPLHYGGELVGAITVYRQEVRPFTDKQIELVKNFAAQAVIAIENTRLLSELRQRTADLTESLEQQTATSEVLRVISSSPGELEPVFQAMLENATRICEAKFGTLLRFDGKHFYPAAQNHTPRELAEYHRKRGPNQPTPGSPLDRQMRTKQVCHTPYAAAEPVIGASARLGGARSFVAVPMLKDNELIGAITIYRQEVRPFSDKQIVVVRNFAAQAVIAIENTRLLSELRQRTADLTESLEQQTATSEVLRAISSSPGELQTVFATMLENATRICEAEFGNLLLYDGHIFRHASVRGPAAWEEFRRSNPVVPFNPKILLYRAAATRQVQHVADLTMDETYLERDPAVVSMVEVSGARTVLVVPMLKENELVGAIGIFRTDVRPFTDKQIALVQNFAAQAVIAIENARLLNELRESLAQQTATSDVLRVISSSPGELEPVFQAMLGNATRLCEANSGTLALRDGDALRAVALHGGRGDYADERRRNPVFRPAPNVPVMRAVTTKQVQHVADMRNEQAYIDRDTAIVTMVEVGGARTFLAVPMLKDDEAVGVIIIYRQEVRPFTDKQIALVQNFAAQAVIAIENARLLNELRESLEQQTATADVLKVISRSTFDLRSVLDTLVQSAARLCEADMAAIRMPKDAGYQHVASYGIPPDYIEAMRAAPLKSGRSSVIGRVLLERQTVHIHDVRADPDFVLLDIQRAQGWRTALGVPLMREGAPIGVLFLSRRQVKPFTDKQIELVNTFADQAVIAIENVGLFQEIHDKSRELEIASKHKSQFLANMSHELRTPLNAILGYTELILDDIYGKTPQKMRAVLERVQTNGKHLLGLINDVLDLSKIEAGQLTLSLADYSILDMVQGVYTAVESLANNKKLKFTIEVPPGLPPARGDVRRLSQVLLNIVGNAIKFTDTGEVTIKAAAADGGYSISVCDTGPGIAPEDQSKIFEEFQQADNSQTKAKGGTGLGLAIARRIVEMHGGRLWVESSPGQGATFSFTVPLRVEREAGRQ